jgi:hypothetical protein
MRSHFWSNLNRYNNNNLLVFLLLLFLLLILLLLIAPPAADPPPAPVPVVPAPTDLTGEAESSSVPVVVPQRRGKKSDQ